MEPAVNFTMSPTTTSVTFISSSLLLRTTRHLEITLRFNF